MSHGFQQRTRTTIAWAVMLLASEACFAQSASGVNVYGLMDVGVTSVSGYAGGRRNDVASGVMSGSRWGVKGNEDLGGNWRALFTIEGRVEADTGMVGNRPASGSLVPARIYASAAQPALQRAIAEGTLGAQAGVNLGNTSFDRQAYVGLVTPVGAVLAGRQYTPAFEVGAQFDAMGTDSFLSPGQLASLPAGLENRANNAVAYRMELGPWSGSAMLALGEMHLIVYGSVFPMFLLVVLTRPWVTKLLRHKGEPVPTIGMPPAVAACCAGHDADKQDEPQKRAA